MNKTNRSSQNFDWQPGFNQLSTLFGADKMKIDAASQPRQVMLIGNGNAFAEGIMNLLNHQPNLKAWHEKYQDDVSILREVMQHQPDVVVLVASRAMNLETILGMLMSTHARTHLRLVILSMETNKVEIYETENTTNTVKSTNINMLEVDDFLEAINKNWNAISRHPIL